MAGPSRKVTIISVAAALLVAMAGVLWLVLGRNDGKFTLSPEFYSADIIDEVPTATVAEAVEGKKSFVVLVSQPGCNAAERLENNLTEVAGSRSLRVLKVDFADLKATDLAPELKFYPSVIIYHDGELVDFLDADSSDDTLAYTTTEGLEDWLESYINFRK